MRFDWSSLTPAEKEIIQLIADGLTNGEIAQTRVVALSTIKNQIYDLMKKTGLNRGRLVALSVANGYVKVTEKQ